MSQNVKRQKRGLLSQIIASTVITFDVAACIKQTGVAVALIIAASQAPQLIVEAVVSKSKCALEEITK